jgi:hypothetical protein
MSQEVVLLTCAAYITMHLAEKKNQAQKEIVDKKVFRRKKQTLYTLRPTDVRWIILQRNDSSSFGTGLRVKSVNIEK